MYKYDNEHMKLLFDCTNMFAIVLIWRFRHNPSTAAPRRHSMPVYLQSKDQAHDHTARLTIHSSQAG